MFRFPAETEDFCLLKCSLISVWTGKNVTVVAADGDSDFRGYETDVKWHLKLTSHAANYSLI